MADGRWYLVAYDVCDDKRLRRVAKYLEGCGERIQYSLFRCRWTTRQMEEARWELEQIMELEDDLMVVHLCPTCSGRIVERSKHEDGWSDPEKFEIL